MIPFAREIMRVALDLAEIDIATLPLNGNLYPARKGWTEATTVPRDVTARFTDVWNPGGIAIRTGKGLGVLDLDRNHADGADGSPLAFVWGSTRARV